MISLSERWWHSCNTPIFQLETPDSNPGRGGGCTRLISSDQTEIWVLCYLSAGRMTWVLRIWRVKSGGKSVKNSQLDELKNQGHNAATDHLQTNSGRCAQVWIKKILVSCTLMWLRNLLKRMRVQFTQEKCYTQYLCLYSRTMHGSSLIHFICCFYNWPGKQLLFASYSCDVRMFKNQSSTTSYRVFSFSFENVNFRR